MGLSAGLISVLLYPQGEGCPKQGREMGELLVSGAVKSSIFDCLWFHIGVVCNTPDNYNSILPQRSLITDIITNTVRESLKHCENSQL